VQPSQLASGPDAGLVEAGHVCAGEQAGDRGYRRGDQHARGGQRVAIAPVETGADKTSSSSRAIRSTGKCGETDR